VSEFFVAGRRLFTGVVRDISDRRRAEEEARRRRDELSHAARLSTIGELSSGIAHEINQPLTAIVSFSEACLRMLRAGDSDTGKLENALEQIAAQGQRAGHITRHLRRLARKGEREHVEVDINHVVRDVLGLVRNELDTNGITLRLDLDESLPPVECNRIQIEQVVLNLVRNSMDMLEDGETRIRALSVRTRPGNDRGIALEVEDSGGGFGDAGPDRVFETFFTTKPDGLGMGLSISRTIIEDHGGRLWASEGTAGAVFHVAIPTRRRAAC
jgi:C4-dicarboxylate-specific signal transduction histidine kinase